MKTKLGYKKTGNKIKHASKEYNYYVWFDLMFTFCFEMTFLYFCAYFLLIIFYNFLSMFSKSKID